MTKSYGTTTKEQPPKKQHHTTVVLDKAAKKVWLEARQILKQAILSQL